MIAAAGVLTAFAGVVLVWSAVTGAHPGDIFRTQLGAPGANTGAPAAAPGPFADSPIRRG